MAAAVRGAKRSLRAELKQRLRALSDEERRRQSLFVTQQVLAHSHYQKASRVAVFLSMPDEVRTEDIVLDVFRRGKACFIPRYRPGSRHMDMVRLASPQELAGLPRTAWNIPQPPEDDPREEALAGGGLDLIFMPGLGFDGSGRRLGRGGGYYDAYLRRCREQQAARPYTLALAFREQLCPQVPVDEDDEPVDEVLYEGCRAPGAGAAAGAQPDTASE
ncbi:5-formyltetrahydrofolate cyclo-ligase [Erinaceus europaeus]|uniref:5-formyltetrahydrofolate cyclo-ligase n=1 Tax=Erinaceus europaeus TaxID=9365 RepID=A0A1S2ZNK3_ERIEU|nr:5-formyltetrahydrofolate cyclo-ligase [Erinaceus europaeus]